MAVRVTLKTESTDPNGDTVYTTTGYVNPDHTATGTTCTKIENAVKAANNLTKNTYNDTIVTQQEPLSELVAAEEEG